MPSSVYQVLEAAGLSDSQPQFLEFDTGVIAYAIPALNAYYVIPSQNTGGVGDPTLEVAFSLNGPTLKYGATVVEAYQPGTLVIIARVGPSVTKGTPEGRDLTIIMGSVPKDTIVEVGPFQNRYLMPGININYYSTPFADSLKASNDDTSMIQDRNYGRHIEALAGDWAVINDFMNHFMVGTNYASFGSLRARVESHSLHNRLKLTADDLRIEGLGSESASRPDLKELLDYSRKARTILEGMGSVGLPPVELEEDTGLYKPVFDNQIGIFRHEEYEGELVEGLWNMLQIPEEVAGVRTQDAGKPPFGVNSEYTLYNGMHEQRGATQIASVKSPYVPVMRSLIPEDDIDTSIIEEVDGKSWQEKNSVSEEDYPNVAPANSTDEFDHNTAEFWRKRMRARTENWKVYTPDEVKGEYGIEMDRRKEMDALGEEKQDYPLPEMVEIKDPATGKKFKYYAAESFIKQLPDGSISISDGYGAEIRMVRGRLIISSATDIEVRPGRDLNVMAARHASLNAGDSLFMQASNGSAYLKAEKDLRVLAGNSGKGTLTLESRGTEAMDAHDNDQDPRVGGGIVIKSMSNLGIVGKHMYMGIYDETDASANGLKRTENGTIIIDSCGGVLGMLGSSMYGNFKTSVAVACTAGTSGSAMTLGSGSVGLFADRVDVGTSNCVMNNPQGGTVPVKTLGVSGVVTEEIQINGSPILSVGGTIQTRSDIFAGGSMGASSMFAGAGAFGGATQHFSHSGGSSPSVSIPNLDTKALKTAGEEFEKNVGAASATLYKGKNLQSTGFAYPSAENLRITEYKMHATRWQNMLKDPKQWWYEKKVDTPDGSKETYTYPGKKFWVTEDAFFMGVNDKTKLQNGYIINTTQED